MALSFSPAEGDGDDEVTSAINTTPLVDVMLVLLIIFLITVPVVTQTAPVRLPREVNQATQTKPENINLSVDRDGKLFWNDHGLADHAQLLERLKTIAVQEPQPEVHIRGDQDVRYEFVGRVVVAVQRAGIARVAFISEPPPRGG